VVPNSSQPPLSNNTSSHGIPSPQDWQHSKASEGPYHPPLKSLVCPLYKHMPLAYFTEWYSLRRLASQLCSTTPTGRACQSKLQTLVRATCLNCTMGLDSKSLAGLCCFCMLGSTPRDLSDYPLLQAYCHNSCFLASLYCTTAAIRPPSSCCCCCCCCCQSWSSCMLVGI